jgi:hypothetical protein
LEGSWIDQFHVDKGQPGEQFRFRRGIVRKVRDSSLISTAVLTQTTV